MLKSKSMEMNQQICWDMEMNYLYYEIELLSFDYSIIHLHPSIILMSYKLLPSSKIHSNNTFFYKSNQIRFKELINYSVVKPQRPKIVIERDPWRSMKDQEIGKLIKRLDDRPEELYDVIKNRNRKKNKFKLICIQQSKENKRILQSIENKKKHYQRQFRTLLRSHKSQTINILLPKLESVHYLFKDKLHGLKIIEKTNSIDNS